MRFLLLLGLGCKKHLKIEENRNYYFKTTGYCSRTKFKSSLILRRFYATWPLALRTLSVLSTNVARSTMGLACLELKKAKTKTKTIQAHLLLYQSGHVCERVYR